MNYMFYHAESFSGHDLRVWDVDKVKAYNNYDNFDTGWENDNYSPFNQVKGDMYINT